MDDDLPEAVKDELTDLLRKLEARTELEACAVVSKEGLRIACAVSAELDADVYSAASAALVNLGETTLKQLRHGGLVEIIVRGEDGYTILTGAGSKHMIIGSCKNVSRMGYYLALLHRFSTKVADILGTQIEAPALRPGPVPAAMGPTAASLLEQSKPSAGKARASPVQVKTPPKQPTPTPKPTQLQSPKLSHVRPEPMDNKISQALEYLTPMEEPEPIRVIEEPEPISLDEPEPLIDAEEPEPIPFEAPRPIPLKSAPKGKAATGDVDKGALFEALHALGTDKEPSVAPPPSSKVDTKALMDALKPQPTSKTGPTKVAPPKPASKPVPFAAQPPPGKPGPKQAGKPSATAVPSTGKDADEDLFKISDREAVLEALRVLGWSEAEEKEKKSK